MDVNIVGHVSERFVRTVQTGLIARIARNPGAMAPGLHKQDREKR